MDVKDGSQAEKRQRLLNFLQERMARTESQSIPRRKEQGPARLSFAQQRLWFFQQLEPNAPTYHVPMVIRMKGPLDAAVMERTLEAILARHEGLRTTFAVGADNDPVQVVHPPEKLTLPIVDFSGVAEEQREAQVQDARLAEALRPFDFVNGPLVRFLLLRLGQAEHLLLITMHHIISDGWSVSVLLREMGQVYEALLAGEPVQLEELPIQYADFSVWQREQFQGNALDSQVAFWKEQLQGANPVLEIPTDYPRPVTWTFRGNTCIELIPLDLLEQAKELTRQERTTLFMTLLAVFQALLYRYTGQEDLLVGAVTANRNRSELANLIGFFVNTLPLRTKLTGTMTFRELLQRVRTNVLGSFANQDLPFERLVEIANVQRDASRSPLVQTVFTLQTASEDIASFGGMELDYEFTTTGTAKFDLVFDLTEKANGLRLMVDYGTDLYEEATIKRLMAHFRQLLEAVVVNPDLTVAELPLLSEAERQQILVDWNDTRVAYPEAQLCLHTRFEQQAAMRPDAVAAVFGKERLTYRELNERANQVAHLLRAKGVGPDQMIGLCVERSLTMLVGVLGILKAGAAYVPIDPSYPADRIGFILEDAEAPVILTEERFVPKVDANGAQVICLDRDWAEQIAVQSVANPENQTGAQQLAYVIFTSGSTGRPKGVLIEHAAASHFVSGCIDWMNVTSDDRFLQFASLSFDVSVFEIFTALLAGSSVHLAPREQLISPEGLTQVLHEQGITIADLPPTLLMLLDHEAFPALRLLFVGTEAFSGELVKRWAGPHRRFLNGYGPTEATVAMTAMDCRGTYRQSPPIGRPMPNQLAYVLDESMNPVPIGVPGELYAGGAGVARGYVGRPDLTAEKFVENPFVPGTRLYKTGDLVRWLADGNLEFMGRTDSQVKIRGFRIELGEIEAALYRHPVVQQAVVIVREDLPSGKGLVAYLVPTAGEKVPVAGEMRRFLAEYLPGYMVPSIFVPLETMPLTPSGKVDRKALPVPEVTRAELGLEFVAPTTLLEKTIASTIAQLLHVPEVGVQDHFFELGGNSLLATQLVSRLRNALQVEVPLQVLFERPTVADLVLAVEEIDPEIEEQLQLLVELEDLSEQEMESLLGDPVE